MKRPSKQSSFVVVVLTLLAAAGTSLYSQAQTQNQPPNPARSRSDEMFVLACLPGMALAHMGIDSSEFQRRRQSAMNAVPDGIILLHSFSAPKGWSESGFQQDSNFYYLTGLENLHDAILAIDGTTKESWLFVTTPTEREERRFAGSVLKGWDSVYLTPDHQTEQLLGMDHIVVWDGFSDFIETRRKANPAVVLYLDHGGQGKMVAEVSDPPGLSAIENPYVLWPAAIKAKWPDANIADATPILHKIRAVKSPDEVALMKKAAGFTDSGFRAAMAAIAPGRTNRQIEGAAIEGALRAGADGISMWPELKTGLVSGRTIFQKFYDYHDLNRTVQAGETVLMDLSFSYEFYKGDVGRTIPVSGHFTQEQREVIDLMSGAYQSGMKALHDGVNADEIIQTCIRYVEDRKQGLRSELARRAALELIKPSRWIMYTHGIDNVEIFPVKELHTGNTVAFGPDFDVDGLGFYEEDVALITAAGYQLINPPFPDSADGIEKMMARVKQDYRTRNSGYVAPPGCGRP
jgi:Xaa-Pro aminopeptidase